MASTVFEVLDNIEKGRQHAIKNARLANLPATDNMGIHSLGDLFLMQNNEETIIIDDEWERPDDWFNIQEILLNAEEKEGLYPGYIISISDTLDTTKLSKTATKEAFGGNGYLTSDGAWYNTTTEVIHTWDRTKDKPCSRGYKTRYIIVYVSNKTQGINISINNVPILEFFADDITISKLELSGYMVSSGMALEIENIECTDKTTFNSLSTGCFEHCDNLKRVKIPNLLTIKSQSFYHCSNLKTVILPNVTTIESQGFRSCYSLEKISFPLVKTTGQDSFQDNYNLKEVYLPELETDSGGFKECTSLQEISLPKLKTASSTFSSCYNLKQIHVPELEELQGTFSYCVSLENISLDNVKEVGRNSFYGCEALRTLSLPKLKIIKSEAFTDIEGLEEFTVPSTVESIETTNITSLFRSCYGLRNLHLFNGWKYSLDLSHSLLLTKECLIEIMNALADVNEESASYTLTIGATNLSKLTEEDLLIATSKGWTIN